MSKNFTATRLFVTVFFLCGVMIIQTLAAPGDLDTTFGNGGKVLAGFGFSNTASAVAIQTDGKIIAAGPGYPDNHSQDFLIARYNANGSLDTSFGSGGRVLTDFSGGWDSPSALVLQPDGKIVAAGSCGGVSDFALVRYNVDGSLDSTFGNGGKVITDFNGQYDSIGALVLQTDGKLVAAGLSSNEEGGGNWLLVRYNSNGSLDSTFGTVFTGAFEVNALALQADGKIVAAGQAYTTNTDFGLARYNSNGTLDTTFGTGGRVTTHFGYYDWATEVVIQPDGKILAAGSAGERNNLGNFVTVGYLLARYNANGSLDTTFGNGGKVFTENESPLRGLALQADGKIVLTGHGPFGQNASFLLIRYNSNGALDTNFGTGGRVTTQFGSPSVSEAAVVQPDGKIVAAGSVFASGSNSIALVRYRGNSIVPQQTKFDYDGDGRADISVFRPSDQIWYLNCSQDGFSAVQFGISTDKLVPADYDGDGKTDIAVYRDGIWYLQRSKEGFLGIAYGVATDIPMPADYDGDGKAEIAVFRPSDGGWYIYNLVNNQFTAVQFGQAGDVPVAADYDGDGKTDIAVFRNQTWYQLRSRDGFRAVDAGGFAQAEDRPVPADYDGDGKADIAMFRNGSWFLARSQLGNTIIGFGNETDLPVPADYDGDGITDIAVYRPSNGTWYIRKNQTEFTGVVFGAAIDKPVPNAFVGRGIKPIEISDFSFAPSTIDTTNSSQSVTVTIRARLTERDVSNINVSFRSLSGNQRFVVNLSNQDRISGNARDGVYRKTAAFPQYSKAGTWRIEGIYVQDGFENRFNSIYLSTSDLAARGFATDLQVISNNEDVIPPEISDFNFTPTSINTTNGSRNVTVTVHAKDARAGVSSISVYFTGPAGCDPYEDECWTFEVFITGADRISGDDQDGVYRVILTIPQDYPFGIYWASVNAKDAVSNFTSLGSAQLAALGYPSQLEITSAAQNN